MPGGGSRYGEPSSDRCGERRDDHYLGRRGERVSLAEQPEDGDQHDAEHAELDRAAGAQAGSRRGMRGMDASLPSSGTWRAAVAAADARLPACGDDCSIAGHIAVGLVVDSWKHVGDRVHSKHPKKEVNEVLDYADILGHKVEQTAAGHKWGRITCSLGRAGAAVRRTQIS